MILYRNLKQISLKLHRSQLEKKEFVLNFVDILEIELCTDKLSTTIRLLESECIPSVREIHLFFNMN